MEVATFDEYTKCIDVIKAREMLDQMIVVDYPKLKKERRQQIYKKVRGRAYPVMTSDQKTAAPVEDFVRAMMKSQGRR